MQPHFLFYFRLPHRTKGFPCPFRLVRHIILTRFAIANLNGDINRKSAALGTANLTLQHKPCKMSDPIMEKTAAEHVDAAEKASEEINLNSNLEAK